MTYPQGERALLEDPEYIFFLNPSKLGVEYTKKVGSLVDPAHSLDGAHSMLHLLGFPEICILDLVAILFYPAKVPSIGFDFLLDSCLVYCATLPLIKILFAHMLTKTAHFLLSTRLKN